MMTHLKTSKWRSLGTFLWMGVWLVGGAAFSLGLLWSARFLAELKDRQMNPEFYPLSVLMFGIAAAGALACLANALSHLSSRYTVGASEITLHEGMFWRSTKRVPILDITEIGVSRGPLMRLFGISDLSLGSVKLYGLRDGEAVRRAILDRRESLHEGVLDGSVSHFRTPQDLLFERLDRVLERIEHHLPPAPKRS